MVPTFFQPPGLSRSSAFLMEDFENPRPYSVQGVIDKCKDYITLKEFPYCLLDYSQTHAYIYHQPRLGYQKSRFSNDLLRIPWYRILPLPPILF